MLRFDHAHATAAATGQGLDHHGAALAQPRKEVLGLCQGDGVVDALGHRHAAALRQGTRLRLVAEQVEHLGRGAHEDQAGRRAGARKVGVLAEQAVARMNMGAAFGLRRRDHVVDVQVGRHALARQDLQRIHMKRMLGGLVVFGHQAHSAPAQFMRGAGDADGDLATVGDQEDRLGG